MGGVVFFDKNDNGLQEGNEPGISGVQVTLTGTDYANNPVSQVVSTDARGHYTFTNLFAGTYDVRETQPSNYNDGQDALGTTAAR